jgi:putative peptide zinc metalloprotease protein
VIAVLSPKGGVGKTTSTYLVGDALAELGRVRVVGLDTNPDYGTLASLVPDALRSDHSLVDLLDAFERCPTFAELRPYLSQVRGGLKLLSAPSDPYVMQRLAPADYDTALELLAQHVEVALLDCGTGLAGPLARWAIQRADQVVIVTTPDWVTSNNVAGALSQVPDPDRATLVLNQARPRGPGDQRAIEDHFRRQAIEQRVTIPYDEQLRTMLDSGTYDLAQLGRPTRRAIKSLAVTVGEGLR